MSDKLMTPINDPGFGSSLPATTIRRCTRLILINEKIEDRVSLGEQVTTPSNWTERNLSASPIVKSSAVCAPFCTSFYPGISLYSTISPCICRQSLTMTSTVSYRLMTLPLPSTIGTALIPRSENMWTTSNTVVLSVAVASGYNGLPSAFSFVGST